MNVPFAYREPQYLILLGLFETAAVKLNYTKGITAETQEWLELYRRNLYKGMIYLKLEIRWEK